MLLIPDTIQRDGNPITGTNANVWVGQQINLTNMISGVPTNSITSWSWSIPGANGNTNTDTAIYDYEPQTNSPYACNYTNLVTPTNYLTNSSGIPFCNFYWTTGGTNVVSCTTVIYGQTNTVSATFNVSRPTFGITSTTNAIVSVDNDYYDRTDYPAFLHFGGQAGGSIPGIWFVEANSQPSGSAGTFAWNQIINTNIVQSSYYSFYPLGYTTLSNSPQSGLDTTFPYTNSINAQTNSDAPSYPLYATTFCQVAETFDATMFLIWQPTSNMVNGDKTVWVPLRGIHWNWSGTATNSSVYGGGTWGLQSSTNVVITNDYNVTNEPIWTQNAHP